MASFGLNTLNPPSTDGDSETLIDIVVVHGLYGSQDRSWTDAKWHDRLSELPEGTRLSLYTYDVFGSKGGVLTRSGAGDEAGKLLDSLLELRKKDSKPVAITLAGHDIGGSLIKAAVVLSQQQQKYENIYMSITTLTFLGCPHGGPKSEIQAGFAEILMSHDGISVSDAWHLTGPLAEWVLETNDAYLETRLSTIVATITYFSSHPDRGQRVFDQSVASLNAPRQIPVVADRELGHRDLLKDYPFWIFLADEHLLSPHRRNLLPLTPPHYPFGTPLAAKDKPQWSAAIADLRQWMTADGAAVWLIPSSPGGDSSPGNGPSETAGRLYSLAETTRVEALGESLEGRGAGFVFDPTDCRYDSAEAMLVTFLTEHCRRCFDAATQAVLDDALRCLAICRRPRKEDLYAAFVDVLLDVKADARANRDERDLVFVVVLGNLDARVRDGGWLFRRLLETVSDCDLRLKVVITSADHGSLASDFEGVEISRPVWANSLPAAALPPGEGQAAATKDGGEARGDEEEEKDNTAEDQPSRVSPTPVIKDVLALVQDRPHLYGCIDTLVQLGESAEDGRLRRMVTNWLRLGDLRLLNERDFNESLGRLVRATPDKVFESILASVPPQKHAWLTRALTRVLSAFRPLTLSEFLDRDCLEQQPEEACSGEHDSTRVTEREGLERSGHGLLVVERNEVRLAHPGLRAYLESSRGNVLGGWFQLQPEPALHHKQLAESCLDYLASTTTRQTMERRASEAGSWYASFERRDSFLSYAVKYWLRHAMLAVKEQVFMSEACERFLADQEAVRLWAVLYRALTPPLTSQRSDPTPADAALLSLAIFAEHGAEDLLSSAMQKHQKLGTPELDAACYAALVAAAGQGHIRMAKDLKLLEMALPEGETFDQLILAALESDDPTGFAEIFPLLRQHPEKIRDTTTMLARAASLGRTEAVRDLLGVMGPLTAPADSPSGLSPLSYACQRGFFDVVDLLICEGGPGVLAEVRQEQEGATPMPIKLAVKWGQRHVLNQLTLVTVSGRPENADNVVFYRRVISESNRYGRRKPVQSILDDIKRRLEQPTSDQAASDASAGSAEDKGSADLAEYLAEHVLSREEYGEAVQSAILTWNQAYDLLDVLCQASNKLSQDEFASVFVDWMAAAVGSKDLRVLKLVFENGAKSPWATTEALKTAATKAFEEALILRDEGAFCMPYLIGKGADITSKAANGETPLFTAAYKGLVKVVEILITAQVDVNAKGDDDWYPLHACYDNDVITRVLLAQHADVNKLTETDDPLPPLAFAVRWGYGAVVDELLKGNPSRQTLQAGLAEAFSKQKFDIAEKLMAYCPDASYLPDWENSLRVLVSKPNPKMLERLLNYPYRIDPSQSQTHGITPLHYISRETSVEVVEMLVRCGANVEATTDHDETPLLVAVIFNNFQVARYLIEECGALITNGSGYYGKAIHTACRYGTLDIVKLLHATPAGPGEVNRIGPGLAGTPLQSALQRGAEMPDTLAIVKYLVEEAGADVNQPSPFWGSALHVASLTSTPETMRLLISHGAAVDGKDHVDRTPLHLALYRTREHVELLLDRGADLDAVDVVGRTALHRAVLSGRVDLVRFVLGKRPGLVNQKDAHDWTPLLWALRVSEFWGVETGEKKAIVEELLKHKARRLVRGQGMDRNWTPLTLATYYDLSDDIVELLMPTDEDKANMSDADREWDWESRRGKKGVAHRMGFCDHCLLRLHGLYYGCLDEGCPAAFCSVCYLSISKLHPDGREFELRGKEEDGEFDPGNNGGRIESANDMDEDVSEAPLENDEEDDDGEDQASEEADDSFDEASDSD